MVCQILMYLIHNFFLQLKYLAMNLGIRTLHMIYYPLHTFLYVLQLPKHETAAQ